MPLTADQLCLSLQHYRARARVRLGMQPHGGQCRRTVRSRSEWQWWTASWHPTSPGFRHLTPSRPSARTIRHAPQRAPASCAAGGSDASPSREPRHPWFTSQTVSVLTNARLPSRRPPSGACSGAWRRPSSSAGTPAVGWPPSTRPARRQPSRCHLTVAVLLSLASRIVKRFARLRVSGSFRRSPPSAGSYASGRQKLTGSLLNNSTHELTIPALRRASART